MVLEVRIILVLVRAIVGFFFRFLVVLLVIVVVLVMIDNRVVGDCVCGGGNSGVAGECVVVHGDCIAVGSGEGRVENVNDFFF